MPPELSPPPAAARAALPTRWMRFQDRCARALERLMLVVLLMFVGAIVALSLVKGLGPMPAPATLRSGNPPLAEIAAAQPVKLPDSAESTPSRDVTAPCVLVQGCVHLVGLDCVEDVTLIDGQTYTVRQLKDAIKVLSAMRASGFTLRTAAPREQPIFASPPIVPGADAEESPSDEYVDVVHDPGGVEVDRSSQPAAPDK